VVCDGFPEEGGLYLHTQGWLVFGNAMLFALSSSLATVA
jgi:hypothetical protein